MTWWSFYSGTRSRKLSTGFIGVIFILLFSSIHILNETFLSLFLKKIIYLFLAVLGPRCCTQALPSCRGSEWGPLLAAGRKPPIAVASLLRSAGSRHAGPSSLSMQAQQLRRTWHAGSSRTRARTRVPCTGRRTPNHCATREVPLSFKCSILMSA